MKIKTLILSFFLCLLPSLVLAQSSTTAGLLPNAVQQFFDNNGKPLSSGKVYFYEVGTTTFKDTYTSSEATTPNQNPITLNAGGKAPTGGIYGIGLYRQVVRDRNGNLIWDAVTEPGSGSGGGTNIGDGNLVGTVLPWSGLVAPNQYLFAYGQEITRADFPEFFTAVTQRMNVTCSSGSNVLSGMVDTTQIRIGSPVELSLCFGSGTVVISKTTTTVVISNPSSVSTNAIATFLPWGNGNGSTTFNVPDLRGQVIAGRDNMGGTASGRLSTLYYGTDPAALGASGGSQTHDVQFPQILVTPGGVLSGNSLATATINSVQPTLTLNYIVKVSPDVSGSSVDGVASIGGMTGVISCGVGLICTGNVINTLTVSPNALSVVGTGWGLTGGPCTVTCTVSVATSNPAFQYGNPVNVQINASVASNVLTISLKANDGTDPTPTNPILLPFRDATASNGNIVWLAQTGVISTTVISGATLGTSNATPFRIWLGVANDSGTPRLCVINTLSGINIYPLSASQTISSSGVAANSAHTFYCGTAVSGKAFTLLGYITYESGLSAAGVWTSVPNVIQLYGPGVPLPGETIQTQQLITGALATGTAGINHDNTIPDANEGNLYMSVDITPKSAANMYEIESKGVFSSNTNSRVLQAALFKDVTVPALAAVAFGQATGSYEVVLPIYYAALTAVVSQSTFRIRAGQDNAATTTFNGVSSLGIFGGVMNSYLRVKEIMR